MKTRIITAVVGLIVLAGVLFTFDTLVFNLVIAAITLIALHEIYSALGFEKRDWPLLAVLVSYTLLIMLSSYSVCRAMVMPASFLVVLFYAIYLVVRNGVISYQKASGLAMFSGIVIFCFYSFIRLKEMLPVEEYGYDAIFFILLILCFAWGGDTCAYFAGRAFGKHKLCPVVSPKKTVEGAIGGVLGTMTFDVTGAQEGDLPDQPEKGAAPGSTDQLASPTVTAVFARGADGSLAAESDVTVQFDMTKFTTPGVYYYRLTERDPRHCGADRRPPPTC